MHRRERAVILAEILVALRARPEWGARSTTQLAAAVNVPYDRMVRYLGVLAANGLVRIVDRPELTSQGLAFADKYEGWREVLLSYGLHPDQS